MDRAGTRHSKPVGLTLLGKGASATMLIETAISGVSCGCPSRSWKNLLAR